MKVVTSYFYKIRFFTPNIIPLSTAVYDPKWFHQNKGKDYIFLDKNGVINGLRCEMFMPGSECSNLCRGTDACQSNPGNCDFLRKYREQLDKLDIKQVIKALSIVSEKLQRSMQFEGEPVMALIVHEAPSKICSEREVIREWSKANDFPIQEWGG